MADNIDLKKLYLEDPVPDLTWEQILELFGSDGQQLTNPTVQSGVIRDSEIRIIDTEGKNIFTVIKSGPDVGDVIIGDFAGGKGMKYDASASTITYSGVSIEWAAVADGAGTKPDNNADVTADNETFSQNSDIDALQTTNAPAEASADVTGNNTAADTALVNAVSASQVQDRAEQFFLKGIFLGHQNDGLTEFVQASSTITRYAVVSDIEPLPNTPGGNSRANLHSGALTPADTWTQDFRVIQRLSVNQKSTNTADNNRVLFGLVSATGSIGSSGFTGNDKTIAFYIDDDGSLYAYTHNGTSSTQSSAITGVTIANENTYRIDWDNGTNAKFYVNDILKATISTNIPSGTTAPPFLGCEVTSTADPTTTDNIVVSIRNNQQVLDSIT